MIEKKKGSILTVRRYQSFDCTIRDGGLVNNYHLQMSL